MQPTQSNTNKISALSSMVAKNTVCVDGSLNHVGTSVVPRQRPKANTHVSPSVNLHMFSSNKQQPSSADEFKSAFFPTNSSYPDPFLDDKQLGHDNVELYDKEIAKKAAEFLRSFEEKTMKF